mgnify:CR=1 FL=1
MSTLRSDWRLLLGIVIAHLLLYYTFDHTKVFWYLMTGTMFLLIAYSIWIEEVDDELSLGKYLLYGIGSGVILYIIFWLAYGLMNTFQFDVLLRQVDRLYTTIAPKKIWHHIVLILIIIPGEEFFWRGFIQKRLMHHTNMWTGILLSTLLYASVQIYSGTPVLILAAITCGLIWGYLYARKKSLPLVIISHLVFDLLLLIIFPLQ